MNWERVTIWAQALLGWAIFYGLLMLCDWISNTYWFNGGM